MLKVFTTFTGIGSQEMALRNIDVPFKVVGISEVDKHAIICYDAIHGDGSYVEVPSKEHMLDEFERANIGYNFSTGKSEIPKKLEEIESLYIAHKRSKNYGDIRGIDPETLPDFDLFTYSFPCKNLSVQGNREGMGEGTGTQSSLVWECEKIIRVKKPKYLFMENVKGLVSPSNKPHFEKWIETLNGLGYSCSWSILNASHFGVPQNRERVFMISVLNESSPKLPEGELTNTCLREYLDLDKGGRDPKLYVKPERWSHISETSTKQSKLIVLGTLGKKDYARLRVYSSNGFCPTLDSMNGGDREPKIFHNNICIKLSSEECWRIMGYSSEDYLKAKKAGVRNTRLYERAGRGIVAPLLEEIFYTLFIKEPKQSMGGQLELF